MKANLLYALTFKCLGFKSPVVAVDRIFLMAFKRLVQWLEQIWNIFKHNNDRSVQ